MWQSVRVPFLTIIFALLSLFIFTKIFGPIPFSVNSVVSNKQNLFTVSGKGEATAIPDTASLTLGINKSAPTVESAKEQVNKVINKITEDIKNLGVDAKDIKTTNFSVNPNYDYSQNFQKTNGYTVDASILVKIKSVEKANSAVDIATRDGANQVGGVQFVLSDTDRKKLEQQARKDAIKEAKDKAESLAGAAGIRLGRIIDIQESGLNDEPPVYGRAMGLEADAKQSTPTELNPGENKIISNVTLSYETY